MKMENTRLKNLKIQNPKSGIQNSHRGGFTLIEILVALTIVSVVIAALYSTFFLSHRAMDAIDESLVKLQESRTVLDTMKREIESAFYLKDKTYTVFKLDDRDFYGKQASQLHFTSFSSLMPGLSRISYIVEQNEGRMVLIKKIASAYTKSSGSGVELIEDIEAFTVEARHSNKWVKTWDSDLSNNIPDEIKISLVIVTKKQNDSASDHGSPTLFTVSDIIRPKIGKTT